MVSLCFTSFLFTTTVIHAFYSREVLYHHVMLSVMALSIAVHTFLYVHKPLNQISTYFFNYIYTIDKIVAHLAFCFVFCDMLILISQRTLWYSWILIFPYVILMTWFMEHRPMYKHLEKALHSILHLTAICAVHIMLWLKSSK